MLPFQLLNSQVDGGACEIPSPWRIRDDHPFRMDGSCSTLVRRAGPRWWTLLHPPHPPALSCQGGGLGEGEEGGRRLAPWEGSPSPKPAFCWGCTQLPWLARSGLDLCLKHWSRAWKPARWACPRPERRKINLAGKREPPRAPCTLRNPIHPQLRK